MATQLIVQRRRRATAPVLTIVVAVVLVAGLAIGIQSLHSATTGGALAAAPVPTAITKIRAALVLPTPADAAQDCTAFDARSYVPFCGYSDRTLITAPRTTWLACQLMDEAAFLQYCDPGDGGRWIRVAPSAGQ